MDGSKDDLRFFNYLYNFRAECINEWDDLEGRCANNVLHKLKFDAVSMSYCTETSFEIDGDIESDNTLLREDKLMAEVLGISKHPALTING